MIINLLTIVMFVAAYAIKFYASEMVFNPTLAKRLAAEASLAQVSQLCRSWHETILFGSSTVSTSMDTVDYKMGHIDPAYKASSLVEKVGHVLAIKHMHMVQPQPLAFDLSTCSLAGYQTIRTMLRTMLCCSVAIQGTFRHSAYIFLQIYFSDGCLRSPASTCLNSSAVYYPMTNHGLNLLTYYFLDQADSLAADPYATYSDTSFQFVYQVSCLYAPCFVVQDEATM